VRLHIKRKGQAALGDGPALTSRGTWPMNSFHSLCLSLLPIFWPHGRAVLFRLRFSLPKPCWQPPRNSEPALGTRSALLTVQNRQSTCTAETRACQQDEKVSHEL
jgi:hypothetical protein